MKIFFVFLIVGVLFLGVRNIDFSNGLFLLHGSEKELRDIAFFIILICWTIAASLFLSIKKCMILFFGMSIFCTAAHFVWFNMSQAISVDGIPIRESALYVERVYQSFVNWNDVDKEFVYLLHFFIASILCLFFLFTMVIVKFKSVGRYIRRIVKK